MHYLSFIYSTIASVSKYNSLVLNMHWYYKLLARRPHFVLVSVGIFSIACVVVALITKKLPDFDDPTLGFEARGTSIGKRWTAWRNLLEETSASGRLIANPKELYDRSVAAEGVEHKRKKDRKKANNNSKKRNKSNKMKMLKELTLNNRSSNGEVISFEEYDNETFISQHDNWEYGRNMSFYAEETSNKTMEKKRAKWDTLRKLKPPPDLMEMHIPADGFFCESPSKSYNLLIFSTRDGVILISLSQQTKNSRILWCSVSITT